MGMHARLQVLASKASERERELLSAAYHRLVDPKEMGELFKFFCISEKGLQGGGPPAFMTETPEEDPFR